MRGNKNMKKRNPKETIKKNQGLYRDFRNAFENEFDGEDVEGESKDKEMREKRFYKNLSKKEKKAKNMEIYNDIDEDDGNTDNKMMEDEDGESDGDFDGNMHVMDEEVRLNNIDTMKTKRNNEGDKVGKDYHKLVGWQSFRYGKQGNKIKRIERIERAKQFQIKRRGMEMKRSKREGRQSELDLFSIYQSKKDNNDNKKKWKNNRLLMGKLKQRKSGKKVKNKKKVKKKEVIKISKSLQKKLSEKEQQSIRDKKRSWFKGGDIVWE